MQNCRKKQRESLSEMTPPPISPRQSFWIHLVQLLNFIGDNISVESNRAMEPQQSFRSVRPQQKQSSSISSEVRESERTIGEAFNSVPPASKRDYVTRNQSRSNSSSNSTKKECSMNFLEYLRNIMGVAEYTKYCNSLLEAVGQSFSNRQPGATGPASSNSAGESCNISNSSGESCNSTCGSANILSEETCSGNSCSSTCNSGESCNSSSCGQMEGLGLCEKIFSTLNEKIDSLSKEHSRGENSARDVDALPVIHSILKGDARGAFENLLKFMSSRESGRNTGVTCTTPMGVTCSAPTGVTCSAPTGVTCSAPTGVTCSQTSATPTEEENISGISVPESSKTPGEWDFFEECD